MASTMTTPTAGQTGLERARFFPGQLLTADDMSLSTEWVLQKLRRHNRYLHGWGIVCGCDVAPPTGADRPWLLHICPGYLVTPQGDEILIASEATFDLAGCILASADPCAMARPCPPIIRRAAGASQVVYLAVRYVECDARPVRVAPVGCSCGDGQCDYSRVREAYEFCCLDSLPSSASQKAYGCEHLCRGDVLPCPDCPQEGWVVLATITLPASVDTRISATSISFADRRLLYSAAMLREMAICACGHGQPANACEMNPAVATVTADGTSTVAITVTVRSSTGVPVVGDQVSFATSGSCGNLSVMTATTDSAGQARVTYTASTTPGSCTVSAIEASGGSCSSMITQTPRSQCVVAASPTSIPADGQTRSTIVATIRDTAGNPVATTVAFTLSASVPAARGTLSSSVATTANGQASVSYIAATTPGTCTITATEALHGQSCAVTVTQTGT